MQNLNSNVTLSKYVVAYNIMTATDRLLYANMLWFIDPTLEYYTDRDVLGLKVVALSRAFTIY